MRISDWSSDVCAADLILVEVQEKAQLARLVRLQAGSRRHEYVLDAFRRLVGNFLDVHAAVRRGHEHDFFLRTVDEGRQVQLTRDVRRLLDVDRVYRQSLGRSEEHTSELQSLMRISYAVFCLKKKNKNSKNTETSNSIRQKQ